MASGGISQSPLLGDAASAEHWESTASVAATRDQFLERYYLSKSRSTNDDWVTGKVGVVPILLPNTKARKREIGAHDLHHIATGCNAIWKEGEIDIAAYELRTGGCGSFVMGWMIMLGFFFLGLLLRPRSLFQTFVIARGSRNLFGRPVDPRILDMTVAEFRAHLHVSNQLRKATVRDYALFAFTSFFAVLEALFIVSVPVVAVVAVVVFLVKSFV